MARLFDDGGSDYLFNNSVIGGTPPFSVSAWFRCDDVPVSDDSMIWSLSDNATTNNYFALGINGDNQVELKVAAGTTYRATGSISITQDKWHHICGIITTTELRDVYLDGADKDSDTVDIDPSATLDQTGIGARYRSNLSEFFSGDIAEVAVWGNAALSIDEITSLAKSFSPLFVRPQNLLSLWRLIGGSLIDIVGGYDLTADGTIKSSHSPIIMPAPVFYSFPTITFPETEILESFTGDDNDSPPNANWTNV